MPFNYYFLTSLKDKTGRYMAFYCYIHMLYGPTHITMFYAMRTIPSPFAQFLSR
jgi:hypothetical protein